MQAHATKPRTHGRALSSCRGTQTRSDKYNRWSDTGSLELKRCGLQKQQGEGLGSAMSHKMVRAVALRKEQLGEDVSGQGAGGRASPAEGTASAKVPGVRPSGGVQVPALRAPSPGTCHPDAQAPFLSQPLQVRGHSCTAPGEEAVARGKVPRPVLGHSTQR